MKKTLHLRVSIFAFCMTTFFDAGAANLVSYGDFETTVDALEEVWSRNESASVLQLDDEAYSGDRSLRVALKNKGAIPTERLLTHSIGEGIEPESEYQLSFHARQVARSPGYLQEYVLQWFDKEGERLGSSDRVRWFADEDAWKKVSAKFASPAGAASVALSFRFVTGAIEGCHGEALLDDLAFEPTGVKIRATRSARIVSSTPSTSRPGVQTRQSGQPIMLQSGLGGTPVVLGAKPAPQSTEELEAAANEAWARIEEALKKGLNTLERAQLTLLTRDLSVAQRTLGSDVQFREARELIYLHLFYPEGSDGYYRAAERWLSNYPESERGRDLFLSLLYGRLDAAQFSDAKPLIDTFLRRYPEDEEGAALKLIQERLPLYIQAFEGL